MPRKNKNEEYLEEVFESYYEIFELNLGLKEDESLKDKLILAEKSFDKLLKDYNYLFDDLNYTHKKYDIYFNGVDFRLKNNFSSFIKFVLERLFTLKVIDKKGYEYLKNLVGEIDFEKKPISIWPY